MEEKILEFCKKYFKQHGYAPSLEEIAEGVGLKSKSSAHVYIKRLYEAGLLASEHKGWPRAFRVVEMKIE